MSDTPDRQTKQDWRDTIFLPKTDFPMKAGLPQKEPGILARWEAERLYRQIRESRAGRGKFILHDGPPYANGDMHIGHALNHILKDMVVRTQTLLGKDAPYVPGWDCHGLPIEWKIEEQYRKAKKNKDEVPPKEFRAECRAYAAHWVYLQRGQLKRLGIGGDWDHPYLTMAPHAEATIVSELLKFAESGQLYRGAKPVMWSPVEKTALAEAEVEYEEIISTQIDVAFEIIECPNAPELVGAHAVIWTTTPWTIPVNQAIAYGEDVRYHHFTVLCDAEGFDDIRLQQEVVSDISFRLADLGLDVEGRRFIVADKLVETFLERLNAILEKIDVTDLGARKAVFAYSGYQMGRDVSAPFDRFLENVPGSSLAGAVARHPMHALGGFFARPRPFLAGDFVTTDAGTGLVHMAPDHGEDDFALCKEHGIEPVFAVEGDGKYRADWAWLGGEGSVINPKFNAPDGPICQALREAGALLAASADYRHSYPHSWRSKAKLIYRCTPQWFVPMDKPLAGGTLREKALSAIAATRWVPAKGQNRISAMVAGRPDWVLSRQRAWGVPITLFVDRKTGAYLVDAEVNQRIIAAIREEGVDAWDAGRAAQFLGPTRNPDDYEMVTDILDVWFDSGCTHVFTLESGVWPDQRWPADLYLEGSDQHRGWFHSSLLESCATRGRAPYNAVLTHGFTMDGKGMKMSKSLGNTVDPIKLMETYGADILRLWALTVDYTEDHRISEEILKGVADQYRKLRNTFRYLLGALDGFSEAERVADVSQMPELERYILALLARLDGVLRQAVEGFDFKSYVRALTDFCNEDLSAFFFDIRKDVLYCEVNPATGYQTEKRRAYRTVLDMLFHALVRYAAPILVFTTEEVWATRFPQAGSVHLLEWPEVDAGWDEEKLVAEWIIFRDLRSLAFRAAEQARNEKRIGSTLQAIIWVAIADAATRDLLHLKISANKSLIEEIFISGEVVVRDGVGAAELDLHADDKATSVWNAEKTMAALVFRNTHHKCGRCWRHLPEVKEDGALCHRCDDVLRDQEPAQ